MSTKILIIEDNPKDAGLFKHVLELEDYAVEIATTAAEGFSQAQSGNFDVVLTDLNLGGPKSDEGRDLVIQLHTSKPQLPVILMTGGHTAEIAIDVIKQGGFDYFVKPLRVMDEAFRAELVRMVDQAAASKQLMESGVKLPGETVDPGQPACRGRRCARGFRERPPR